MQVVRGFRDPAALLGIFIFGEAVLIVCTVVILGEFSRFSLNGMKTS
jgi:hypothetical protein